MTLPVADYSFARPSDYAALAAAVSGVMRYTSNGPSSKNIDAAEYAALDGHGVLVGITWEADANSMLGGFPAGRAAAASSVIMTRAAGLPDGVTYYACDFDATRGGAAVSPAAVGQMRAVADFLNGAASVTGWDDVGVYGDLFVLQWLRQNTPLKYGWECASWSFGGWANWRWTGPLDPCARFVQNEYWVQGQHEITIAGCPVDFSTVVGDWKPRNGQPPQPNGDLSMADAASLHQDIVNLANLVAAQFNNTYARIDFLTHAEGQRFDALTSALQAVHAAGAAGQPVDIPAIARALTITPAPEGTPA